MFATNLGITNFQASEGWLEKFKNAMIWLSKRYDPDTDDEEEEEETKVPVISLKEAKSCMSVLH